MKKILSTAVALGMVAGVAASASALELKVKGDYSVEGFYFNSGSGIVSGNGVNLVDYDAINARARHIGLRIPGNESESWYQHAFKLFPELVVNDKISMKTQIRIVDSQTIWGSQDDTITDVGEDGHTNLDIYHVYLVYNSPVGNWEIGRRPAGAWEGPFIDSGSRADRIMWKSGKMMGDNFSMYAFLQKSEEKDAYYNEVWMYSDTNGNETWDAGEAVVSGDRLYTTNADNDYYEIAAKYKTDTMLATVAFGTQNDNTKKDDFKVAENWNYDTQMWGATPGVEKNLSRVKGFGVFNLTESFALEGEFDYKWGEIDKAFASGKSSTADVSAWAYYLGLNMKFNALSSTLAYAHIDGDNDKDPEINVYDPVNGTGWDFEPLYIMTGYWANLLNGDQGGGSMFGTAIRQAGADVLVFLADFKVSDDLTLHGGIGYGMADDARSGWDDEYGWEMDAGLAYKLYDNLTYEARFGYMATGDFAKLGTAFVETEDILMASHHLTMSF